MKAKNTITVRQFLVCCCAFWVPWGPLIPLPFLPVVASRVFAAFAVLLIGYWALLLPHKLRPFPKSYNLLVLLIIVHTCVTYGYLFPDEFGFAVDTNTPIDESTTMVEQQRGILVARYFVYLLFGYALASAVRTRHDLVLMALALGTGFCIMMAAGTRAAMSDMGLRSAGGFLNPNSFGQVAMIVVFLSMLVLLTKGVGPIAKGLGTVNLLVGLFGLVSSVSRSAMGALCIGLGVILWYLSFSKRLKLLAVGGLVGSCVALSIPAETWNTLTSRLSADYVIETRGGQRWDTNLDYLKRFPKYAATGVGLWRAVEVTKDSYTTWKVFPPHNAYIQILVEFGCVGLLLFILSLRAFSRGLAFPLRKRPPRMTDVLMLGFFLGWAGLFLVGSCGSRHFFFSWGVIAAYRHMHIHGEYGRPRGAHDGYRCDQRKETAC